MIKKLLILLTAVILNGCAVYGYSFKEKTEVFTKFDARSVKTVSINGSITEQLTPDEDDIKSVISAIPFIELDVTGRPDYKISISRVGPFGREDGPGADDMLCMLTVSLIPCGVDSWFSVMYLVYDSDGKMIFNKSYPIELTKYGSLFYFPAFIVGKPESRLAKDFLYDSLNDVFVNMYRKGLL